MRVLLCHNYYQIRGGEDLSFESEARLLETHGHEVLRFTQHNDALRAGGAARAAVKAVWNTQTYRAVRTLLRDHRPDVMHCTNTFPLLSPSVHYAAAKERVPVVQSLRNYRLTCLNSYLMRAGNVCELCLHRAVPWPGVRHACYRDQRLASAAVATMLAVHRAVGTWRRRVAVFYTPSHFARRKLMEAGLPGDRILVKQNFVDPDPGRGEGRGGYALFAARLAPEKGLDLLLAAWRRLPLPIPLRIIGEGPLAPSARAESQRSSYVQYCGPLAHEEVLRMMGDAAFVVYPSLCYETFGRTIVESFARGTPVVAARLGAMAELVEPDKNGWLFEPGRVDDLAETLCRAITACSPGQRLRDAARNSFEAKYTAAENLRLLLDIYERARQWNPNSVARPNRARHDPAPQAQVSG